MQFYSKPFFIYFTSAPGRADELESLLYLLIYLKEGFLPWDDETLTFKELRVKKEVFFTTIEN